MPHRTPLIICDADGDQRELLVSVFELSGFRVFATDDPAAALDHARVCLPAPVVLARITCHTQPSPAERLTTMIRATGGFEHLPIIVLTTDGHRPPPRTMRHPHTRFVLLPAEPASLVAQALEMMAEQCAEETRS